MKNVSSSIKQVAALDKVSQICNAYGASYNPSNEAIMPTALVSLLEQAREKTKAVNVARAAYILAVTARAEGFEGIPKLAVRVTHLLDAAGLSKEQLEDVKMLKRRFFYPNRKKVAITKGDDGTNPPAVKTTSSYGLGRDSILDKFEMLIELLQSIPAYKPKDTEFQVAQLKARLSELQAINFAAIQARSNLTTARIERNEVLAVVAETTRLAKAYIRGKFGMFSEQAQPTKPSVKF